MVIFTVLTLLMLAGVGMAQNDGTCTFQSDLCGYTTSGPNRYTWSRMKGSPPSQNTGPFNDHNKVKSAYYLYTESSEPAQPGDVAKLESPVISATGKQCLKFYYNAFGDGMGKLEVKIKGKAEKLFEVEGNKGMKWHQVRENTDEHQPFQLVFKSIRGANFTSDMAIDDITIDAGTCQEVEEETNVVPTPIPTKPPKVEAKPYVPRQIYGVARVGCFKDKRNRAFPKLHRMKLNRDPYSFIDKVKECRDKVDSMGEDYEIFGVQFYGFGCWYGSKNNPRMQPFKHGHADNCELETMGAGWSNYVYVSCKDNATCEAAKPPTPPPPPKSLSDLTGIKQIGCYGDKWNRAFPERINLIRGKDKMTRLKNVQDCREHVLSKGGLAAGYKYFALEYFYECFYGKESNPRTQPFKYEVKPGRRCNEETGEGWTMMVYELTA